MSSCLELQREELEVVEAIYPDFVADSDIRKGSVKLEIPIEFDTARRIHIEESSEQNPTSCLSLALSLLPPLLIHVLLPPDYPLDSPPQLISIHTTHLWIPPPRHSALQHLLNQMWQQGEGALYNWIQFIHSGKFLDKLGLVRDDVL
ncbi:hypothetical protein D9757_006311 [Collybiopsis confluens]|uniref:RWD domain-containing protein n=1 Tax=Collybiopsis confluens TaxID=2823264 RepID=A0A8H5HGS7_9AGAR|nr:hypothetical protein D9757_006311 [Collybiopsis confluens]